MIFYLIEKDFGGNIIKVEIVIRKMNINFGEGCGGGGWGGSFGCGEFIVFLYFCKWSLEGYIGFILFFCL